MYSLPTLRSSYGLEIGVGRSVGLLEMVLTTRPILSYPLLSFDVIPSTLHFFVLVCYRWSLDRPKVDRGGIWLGYTCVFFFFSFFE